MGNRTSNTGNNELEQTNEQLTQECQRLRIKLKRYRYLEKIYRFNRQEKDPFEPSCKRRDGEKSDPNEKKCHRFRCMMERLESCEAMIVQIACRSQLSRKQACDLFCVLLLIKNLMSKCVSKLSGGDNGQ
ncbi:hypothetical protein KR018_005468 [Drosophila ironensis]|nr:hypothetical protein KR018_005468 [Drosophila ironensis]